MPFVLRILRRALVGLLVAAFGCAAGLALIEGVMRLNEALHPPPFGRGAFWQGDATFGWGHPPGRAGLWWDEREEFAAPIRINSKGQRDVEHAYDKTPGTFRILLLGDSYVEAVQVELEDSFPRLLERDLLAGGSAPVEIVNTGVADFGTDNELLFFRAEGRKYQPDLVLLGFTLANDVRNNYEPMNRRAAIGNKNKPTFSLDGRGVLQLSPMPAPPPPSSWWSRLRVVRFLAERLGGGPSPLLPAAAPSRAVGAGPLPPPSSPKAVPIDALVHDPHPAAEVDEAWKLTFALLRAMRADVGKEGASFAVFLINGPWVHSDARWRFLLQASPEAIKTWDPTRPNKLMQGFLDNEKVRYIDLYWSFEANKRERLFFREDPHWAPEGHRVAAQAVATFLLNQGLVPKRHD